MKIDTFKTKNEIKKSSTCGCFYCLKTFPASEVVEYWDKNQTPVCPKCGHDSVIGDHQLKNHSLEEVLKTHHVDGFCWGYVSSSDSLEWIPTKIFKERLIKENPELLKFKFKK